MAFFAKIGIKNYITYVLIFILILFVSLPFILNWAVNTSYIKDKISLSISQKTGGNFTASRFSITLLPEIGINVEDCIFQTSPKTNLNIKTIKLSLDIIKLLSGKIDITHISVIQPDINGSEIIWPGKKTNIVKTTQTGMPVDFSILQHQSGRINGVKKIFNLLPEHQDSIEFKFDDVQSSLFKHMDGSYYMSKKKNQIIASISIKNIILNSSIIPSDLEFSKYFDIASMNIDQFECLIEADSQGNINGQCKISGLIIKNKSSQILLDSKNIASSFKITENICQIDVKPFKLHYPESMIEISFKDNGDLKKTDLQFTGTNVNIDQARQMSLLMFK
ncbi:MAG: AsmA family protein, partial [Desulfobacula sp.]|nr:AsmA family protein [Desulfobacula sp.]